jgi:hypothetical protein
MADRQTGSGRNRKPAPKKPGPTAGSGKTSRGSKRREKKKKLKALGGWWFFERHTPGEVVRFRLTGDKIGQHSGDGEAIGAALQRLTRLLRSLDAHPTFENLVWGNSVELEFRARDAEVTRAQERLAKAHELEEEAEAANQAEAFEDEIDATLEEAVPDLLLAVALAADLFEAPASGAPEAAVRLGTDVTQAYKSLAIAIARSGLTLTAPDPDADREIRLTPVRAEAIGEALRTVTEPVSQLVTAFGTLSIADATQDGFGLRLDLDMPRPALLRRRRLIRGTYDPAAGRAIRDDGLWGKEVKATILVEQDALVSTSTIRPPHFTLKAVEARS